MTFSLALICKYLHILENLGALWDGVLDASVCPQHQHRAHLQYMITFSAEKQTYMARASNEGEMAKGYTLTRHAWHNPSPFQEKEADDPESKEMDEGNGPEVGKVYDSKMDKANNFEMNEDELSNLTKISNNKFGDKM